MPLPTNADIKIAIHTINKVINNNSGNHPIDIAKTEAVFTEINGFYHSEMMPEQTARIHQNSKNKLKELADACTNVPSIKKRPLIPNRQKRKLVKFIFGHLSNLNELLDLIDQPAESHSVQSTRTRSAGFLRR